MTKHLEDDGLRLDVLNEGLCHLHCDLMEKRENTSQTQAFGKVCDNGREC